MKAAIRRVYGPPASIEVDNISKPQPKDNEVLIRVLATTVNRTDCANLTAKPFIMRFVLGLFRPRKIILGTDFAGKVEAIGSDISTFKVNDRVFGFSDLGLSSQAEYITIEPKGNMATIPGNINYKVAAASLEGAHYAFTFIHKVNIEAGQSILINGATGGIGSALLQFVKQFDVKITATCNTKNVQLIKLLGADKIYDYTKEDFREDTEKYDFIFDAVGKSTFGQCKSLLKKGGTFISSELGPYSQNLFFALTTSSRSNKQVLFPVPFSIKRSLPYIKDLLEKGKYKPVIDQEYPLEEIAMAYEYVASGEKTGNVIINLE